MHRNKTKQQSRAGGSAFSMQKKRTAQSVAQSEHESGLFVMAAAMSAAGAFFAVMSAVMAFAVVVIAYGLRVVLERAGSKGAGRSVCRACDAAIERDAGLSERHLGTHADAAADQRVHLCGLQVSTICSRTMVPFSTS